MQKAFAGIWAELDPSAVIHVLPNVQEAVELAVGLGENYDEAQVFVTGSFHLVGGVLSILEGVVTPTGD